MKWRIVIGALAIGAVVVVACSIWKDVETDKVVERGKTPLIERSPAPESAAGMSASDAQAQPSSREPLSEEEIGEFRRRILELREDHRERIAARRGLLAALLDRGPGEFVEPELRALVADVEGIEGEAMARRVAFSEANTWQVNKRYEAAIVAYQQLIDRWPESDFAVEALLRQGECRLELRAYAEAEATFRRFVERHDDSPLAGWGWRKLALAQLLQGDFDRSLATLDLMAARFEEGEFAEYAQSRRGYVLMVAGKTGEARKAYEEFLSASPTSRYGRLVKRQMEELNQAAKTAQAVPQF